MSLTPGARIGAYEVVNLLGAGGMGEVYRARDSRLHRDVAIKILPDIFGSDPERLARFEREAQVLASLNHPHIAQIYGIEDRALVMELVEGETLSERIVRGPLPVDEALAIARQIAEGLSAAHDVGIVHRDLKPANVRVRPDGTVKLLDFGLARTMMAAPGSTPSVLDAAALSPTITSPALTTGTGTLLGTAVYMAPEQAKGRTVDKRADIWAFGCVLFEMLTGRRAFDGDGVTETLAAVLMKEPDWRALPAGLPRAIERLLRRCLHKDPRQRLQDIGDARLELDERDEAATTAASLPRARTGRRGVIVTVAVAALAVAGGLGLGRVVWTQASAVARPVRFEIGTNGVSSAVLSPDGSRLAMTMQNKLWIRDLARVDLRAIDGTDSAVRPFWSWDGKNVAYGAHGKLWRVAASGGAPIAICDLAGGLWDEDAGGAWLADNTIVYSDGNTALFQVPAQGGDPMAVLKPDPKRDELHFHTVVGLPDGRSIVYAVHRGGSAQTTDTIALWSGGTARVLLQMNGQELDNPTYSPSGHLLFQRSPTNAGVWAVPFSVSTLEVTGEPFLVAQGMRRPSASTDGTLVLLPPRAQRPLDLVVAGRDGVIQEHVDEPRLRNPSGALSPDGNRFVIPEIVEDQVDIWLYDLSRHTRTRLTREGAAGDPAWTGDGRAVLYDSRSGAAQGGGTKRVTADGSERTEVVAEGRSPVASRDGSTLFFVTQGKDGLRLWYRSLTDATAKPALFIDQTFYSINAAPSPDGRFVASAASTTPGQTEVFVRRFPPSAGVWQISSNGGTSPRWTADGRLLYARGPDIFEVTISATPEVTIGAPQRLFTRTAAAGTTIPAGFDVSPDGRRFVFYEPAANAGEERITVALNWFADFSR